VQFKQEYSFEKRKEVATKILHKYPDRVPVIVERLQDDTNSPLANKKKFLVPRDTTAAMLIIEIKKHLTNLQQDESVLILTNNLLITPTAMLGKLYEKYVDEDGFLYITYKVENVFG